MHYGRGQGADGTSFKKECGCCANQTVNGEITLGETENPRGMCHAGFCDQGYSVRPPSAVADVMKGSICMVPYFAITKRVMT